MNFLTIAFSFKSSLVEFDWVSLGVESLLSPDEAFLNTLQKSAPPSFILSDEKPLVPSTTPTPHPSSSVHTPACECVVRWWLEPV